MMCQHRGSQCTSRRAQSIDEHAVDPVDPCTLSVRRIPREKETAAPNGGGARLLELMVAVHRERIPREPSKLETILRSGSRASPAESSKCDTSRGFGRHDDRRRSLVARKARMRPISGPPPLQRSATCVAARAQPSIRSQKRSGRTLAAASTASDRPSESGSRNAGRASSSVSITIVRSTRA